MASVAAIAINNPAHCVLHPCKAWIRAWSAQDDVDQIVEFTQFAGKYWKIRWPLRSSLVHRTTTV